MKEKEFFKFSYINYEVIAVFILAFVISLSIRTQYIAHINSSSVKGKTEETSGSFSVKDSTPNSSDDIKNSFLYFTKDKTENVDFIQQDIASNQYNIAVSYEKGLGVPQSNRIAAIWYKSAASLGHKLSQYNLAIFYSKGLGIKKDYKESFKWFLSASKAGLPQAQYNLGYMYEEGIGTEKDLYKSYDWYKKASEAGFSIAKNKVKSLKNKIK